MGSLSKNAPRIAFVLAALAATLAPLLPKPERASASTASAFPGWPATFEGRALTELPQTAREQSFAAEFPGKVGRFSDGQREIILRWVAEPTRRLHPASDCFRGLGYAIDPRPMQRDASGAMRTCFVARRGAEAISVCEGIRDAAGKTWSDASSWYWSAIFDASAAPWWSTVVAQSMAPAPVATPAMEH